MSAPGSGQSRPALVADESIGRPLIERLRSEGYDVLAIEEVAPSADDSVVLTMASQRDAVVVTEDKDFGDLVYQRRLPLSSGVILIRLAGMPTQAKCNRVATALAAHESEVKGSFTVISARTVRVRKAI